MNADDRGRSARTGDSHMARSRAGIAVLGLLWVVAIVLLVVAIFAFGDTKLSRGVGFPHMPRYGAITWWFFLVIPLIGVTYGYFNEWRRGRGRE
jgi:hypothetical protein